MGYNSSENQIAVWRKTSEEQVNAGVERSNSKPIFANMFNFKVQQRKKVEITYHPFIQQFPQRDQQDYWVSILLLCFK
jgi:hypothetical protein